MATDIEKVCKSCEDGVVVVSVNSDQEAQPVESRQIAERRLVRKLDGRLLPIVVVVYVMNYIDRVAITSARLKGFQMDLHLSDVQYDTVVAILYASYCPAQILSNMMLNYISRPTLYIGASVVLWGLTSALTGITHNFAGIMTCRVFVGLPEAAFYPGVVYLLSRWYTRKELALRTSVLFSGFFVSMAFGNLLAAAILGNMEGIMGIAGWRWLFYIEGVVTILLGFLAMWLLPDYPCNTRWLTAQERHLAQVRLAEDVGETDEDSQQAPIFEGLKLALKDHRVLLFMLMYSCYTLGSSFSNFFPTLVSTLGYSTTITLLVAAPPWVYSAITALVNSWHADITGERYFHLAVPLWIAMVGYIVSLSTMDTAARYFSMFLMTTACCTTPLILVWVANAVPRPPAKRSAAIGLANGVGNLGTLMGSYIWKAHWGPEYHPSMIIGLCTLGFASLLGFVIRVSLARENKRMAHAEVNSLQESERERIEEAAKLEGITLEEAVRRRMGFRYLY